MPLSKEELNQYREIALSKFERGKLPQSLCYETQLSLFDMAEESLTLREENVRLKSRGIEGMKHRIQELEAVYGCNVHGQILKQQPKNPYSSEVFYQVERGWICPKCGRSYAPNCMECFTCNSLARLGEGKP